MEVDPGLRSSLEWGFKWVLDEDGSGFIEQKECNMVAKCLGLGGENGDINGLWKGMLSMDTDNDGKISMEEYVQFMAKKYNNRPELGAALKEELDNKKNQKAVMQAAMAAAADEDDIEEVNLDGSVAPAAPAPAPSAAANKPALSKARMKELETRFKSLDNDGNGQLTKAEVADALLLEEGDETMEKLWKEADKDGDGSISYDEFVQAADAFEQADDMVDLPGLPE